MSNVPGYWNGTCTKFKLYNLVLGNIPAVPPQKGYLVRWKLASDGPNSPWIYSEVQNTNNGILQVLVPECNAISGQVTTFCGMDQFGNPIYGPISTFNIAASISYNVTISQNSCTLGVARYTISASSGLSVVLRLKITGNAIHDNVNGNCCWITTQLSDLVSTTVNKISDPILDVTTPQDIESKITVVMPNTGSLTLESQVFVYNLLGGGGLISNLEVESIGGFPVTNTSASGCIRYQTAPGCASSSGSGGFTP